MSSSTSACSSSDLKSPPSTTHTSPERAKGGKQQLHEQQRQPQQQPQQAQSQEPGKNKSDGKILFAKKTDYHLQKPSNRPSTFSSYSASDTDTVSDSDGAQNSNSKHKSTGSTSSSPSQRQSRRHYHAELGTSCDCANSPAKGSSNIQTPASNLCSRSASSGSGGGGSIGGAGAGAGAGSSGGMRGSSGNSRRGSASVEIGAQLPFTNDMKSNSNNSTGKEDQKSDPRQVMLRSNSAVVLPSQNSASRRKRNYKPAVHVIRQDGSSAPTSPTTGGATNEKQQQQGTGGLNRQKPAGLKFTSEEQAQHAVMVRNNYSLPPSPSGAPNSPFPRYTAREPKTPLYVPAVLRRTTSQDKMSNMASDDESYFPVMAHLNYTPTGPPSKSHWKPDSARNCCAECNRLFTLFERRHHCRRCGDIYCSLHSRFTVKLDQNVSFNPVKGAPSRACLNCYTEYQQFKESYLSPPPSFTTKQNSPLDNYPVATPQSLSSHSTMTTGGGSTATTPAVTISGSTPRAGHEASNSNNHNLIASSVSSVPPDWQWSTF